MDRRRFLTLSGTGGLLGVAGAALSRSSVLQRPAAETPQDPEDEVEPPSSGMQQIIWSVATTAPLAALTFDDGPDPEYTPRILDILDRHGVKATFMVMGYNAVRHGDLLRDVVAAGHEIGGHGWRHLNLAEVSAAEAREEIEFGTRKIEEQIGRQIRLFRPPYARFGEAAVRLLALSRRDMVLWSLTRGDLGWKEPGRVAAHVVDSLGPGDIVDLHDGIGRGTFNRGAEFAERIRRRREIEVAALPRIVEGAEARGLEFVTVSDLMAAERRNRAEA